MDRSESAQLYTIEAIATSLMLLLVVIFVIKAAPLTPLTSSASHPHIEAQLETRGNDLLATLDYVPQGSQNSMLKDAIIAWDGTTFLGQNNNNPLRPPALNSVADALGKALLEDGIAYNLEVLYNTNPAGTAISRIIWNGRPSDNAVTVSRKIILHNEDNINQFSPIKDIDTVTQFYNSVDVRLTLWRM